MPPHKNGFSFILPASLPKFSISPTSANHERARIRLKYNLMSNHLSFSFATIPTIAPTSPPSGQSLIISTNPMPSSQSPPRKPPSPFLTRIFARLRDTADEYLERSSDHAAGRRDNLGRKTDAWYQHDFQRQRRAKERDEKRKKREERKSLKREEEGMMMGGSGVEGTKGVEGGDGSHAGGSAKGVVFAMPSHHSMSSVKAQVHTSKTGEGAKDSEDEEAVSSDDGSGSGDEEAKKAAAGAGSKAGSRAGGSKAGGSKVGGGSHASGIRGGNYDDDIAEEYNEHEDFDDEYPEAKAEEPTIIKTPDCGNLAGTEGKDLEGTLKEEKEDEHVTQKSNEKLPDRAPQPYILSGIRETIGVRPAKASGKPDTSREVKAGEARKGKESSRPREFPGGNPKAKTAANPEQNLPKKQHGHSRADENTSDIRQQMPGSRKESYDMPPQTYSYVKRPQPQNGFAGPSDTARTGFPSHHRQGGPPGDRWRPRSNAHYDHFSTIRAAGFPPKPAYRSYTGGIVDLDDSSSEAEKGSSAEATSHRSSKKNPKSKRRGRPASDSSSEQSTSDSDEVSKPSKSRASRPNKTKSKRRGRSVFSEESTSESDEDSEPSERKGSRPKKPSQGKGKKPNSKKAPPPKYDDVVDAPPNHYERLGLSEEATAAEIQKASKAMRAKTHPDSMHRKNPGMTDAEKAKVAMIAARVGEAADILKDPTKKREYDEEIRQWKRAHNGRLPKEKPI
ncbi:MAG: hypothetical protein Q9220_003033 [cf. Caloplaca sp. 1 TL-2023]